MSEKKTQPKNAAQWGTRQWIEAHPYSTMDRKRRRRAERAVGEAVMAEFRKGPCIHCLIDRFDEIVKKYDLTLSKKDEARLHKSLVDVAKFETALYDEMFGIELEKAWGI